MGYLFHVPSLQCSETIKEERGDIVKARGWGGPGKNSVSWAWQNFYTREHVVAMYREQKALCSQINTGEARKGKHTAHLFDRRRCTAALPGTGNGDVLQPGDPLPSDETGFALCPRIYAFTYPRPFSLNLEHCFYNIKPLLWVTLLVLYSSLSNFYVTLGPGQSQHPQALCLSQSSPSPEILGTISESTGSILVKEARRTL